ncbi:MAG: winged helix-turn-helix domain-containing protein [Rubrivivax sp.]
MPSVRDCAARHGVSPSTVVGAYDLLQAQGLVQARPQRGFFVREPAALPASLAPMSRRTAAEGGDAPDRDDVASPRPVDATALIRGHVPPARPRRRPRGKARCPKRGSTPSCCNEALRRVTAGAGAQSWLSYGDPAGDVRPAPGAGAAARGHRHRRDASADRHHGGRHARPRPRRANAAAARRRRARR